MEFLVLGPLEVLVGRRLVPLGSAKQRLLLAALLVQANQVVSVDRLADILWGDEPPADATATLQTYVSRLRTTLEPERTADHPASVLLTRAPGYLLRVDADRIDAGRFERLVEKGKRCAAGGEPEAAAAILGEALGLWRGHAFAEFADDDFARTDALHLEELRRVALEEHVDANLALGRHAELVGELEGIIAEHPLRERPRAQLMLALYRCGREAEALRVYQDYRRYLGDELGLGPPAALQRLEAEILSQSPQLEWAAPPDPGAPSRVASVEASTASSRAAPQERPVARSPEPARRPRAPGRSGTRAEPAARRFLHSSQPPFVGRHRELEALTELLDDAASGRPHVVLVSGDAGIGKSRLVRQLQRAATTRGFALCSGRCREELNLPYLPFVGSLLSRLENVAHEHSPDLADFLGPLLGRARSPAAASGSTEPDHVRPEHEQAALFHAVSRATIRLAREQPMVLAIEDLHWADRSSVALFCHLAFEVADASLSESVPLFMIATHRPELDSRLARDLARVRRDETCARIDLSGLDEPECAELVRSFGLEGSSRQLIDTVHVTTGGNPLFIETVVRQLVHSGAVQEKGGALVTELEAAALTLPDEVRGAITDVIGAMSDRGREVMTLASFLGDVFSVDDLSAASAEPANELTDPLEEAIGCGILVVEDADFEFAHPLYRRVLQAQPSRGARQQLHLRVARALIEARAEGDELGTLEIADHLSEAGGAADPAEVLDYTRVAADQAWAMSAWAEAGRYYDAAVAAAASTHPGDVDLAELLYRAGLAHYRNMDAALSAARFEQAIEAFERVGDTRGLALALMERARAELTSSGYGVVVDVSRLEDALAQLGDTDPVLCARILAQLAEAYWVRGEVGVGEELAARALETGRQVSDHAACSRAASSLAIARWLRLDLREALEILEDGLVHARAAGDPWLEGLPLPRIALTLLWLGRLDDAQAAAIAGCESARQTHDTGEHSLALAALVGVAVARGDFRAAERHGHDAWMALRLARYTWSRSLFLPALASARLAQGAWDDALSAIDLWTAPDLLAVGEDPRLYEEGAWVARQLVRAHAGDTSAVRAAFAERPECAAARWPLGLGSVQLFAALAEISDLTNVDIPLERVDKALSRAADRGVVIADGLILLVPRLRGVVASLQRRWDEADTRFEEAVETASRIGARSERGRSLLDHARSLVDRDDASDPERARQLARQATLVFRELGMLPFEQQAAALDPLLESSRASAGTEPVGSAERGLEHT